MANYTKKHGLSNHRLFRIQRHIIDRCYNPNNDSYHNYGAKGITMCDEWRTSVVPFYDWAMKNGYADNLTIERIDNTGNYEPNNCRWATRKEQGNNRSTNKLIEYNGKSLTMKQWSELTGIHYETIKNRIRREMPLNMVFASVNERLTKRTVQTNLKQE